MTAYVQYGPMIDGSAPGIDATLLNGIEGYLLSINPLAVNTPLTPTVINGTSGGTITMWCFAGPNSNSANCFKLYLFYFGAYQNSTGVRQRITLPSPFSTGGIAQVGGIHVPVNNPSNQSQPYGIYTVDNTATGGHNWNVFTAYNPSVSSQYNGALSQAVLPCYTTGEFNNQMSYMDIDGNTTGPANGWVRLMGV